jgi:transposase InsO family protein
MKTSRHTPYGILNPLPVPKCPWRDISMDFVTGLPLSDSHNAIWVVIDRLTQIHLVPCSTTVDTKELTNIFIINIFYLQGLPDSIVSDRGPQFASRFWKYLCNSLHIKPRLSTAFHPKTDGQTERINLVMEQYLRAYINYQ